MSLSFHLIYIGLSFHFVVISLLFFPVLKNPLKLHIYAFFGSFLVPFSKSPTYDLKVPI